MLSYDPDKTPQIDPVAVAEGRKHGLFPISVICDEPDAKVGDATTVQFIAFVNTVPRTGETIVIEDGSKCIVKDIRHVVVKQESVKMFTLMPNLYAVRQRTNV
jgi:ABC-type ATPase involved in cell division